MISNQPTIINIKATSRKQGLSLSTPILSHSTSSLYRRGSSRSLSTLCPCIILLAYWMMLAPRVHHKEDGLIKASQHNHTDILHQVEMMMPPSIARQDDNEHVLMQALIYLSPNKKEITRVSCNLFNLVAEMSGFTAHTHDRFSSDSCTLLEARPILSHPTSLCAYVSCLKWT